MATTRLGLYGGSRAPYPGFAPAAANAVLSGTITTAVESQIVAGGRTIILTIANDTWVSSGATFNAQRQNIIDGLDSAQSEATGWNAEVRDKEVVTAVVRTSDTVVTITLSAAPAYAVDSNETITATIPGTALSGGNPLVANPTFTVTAQAEAQEVQGYGNLGPSQPYKRPDRKDTRQELRRDIIERMEALRKAKPAKETVAPVIEEIREYLRDEQGRFISASGRKADQTGTLPPISALDMEALLDSMEGIESLLSALEAARLRQIEEETLVMIMLAA